MGNQNNKDNIKNFYSAFEKVIVPLEFLARKHYCFNHHLLFDSKAYKKLYENMGENKLVDSIDKSFEDFENIIKSILNSSSYNNILILREWEIRCYIQNIILWKQGCSKYKNMYDKVGELLIKLKRQNLEKKEIEETMKKINDPYEDNINEYDDNTENYQQEQLLIDKQKVIQAQELALLNDNFGRALASLECYANRCAKKEISNSFNYYNMFNLGNTQDLDELQKKAFIQTHIFNLSYEDYVKNYKKYDVPENMKISEIIKLLNEWKSNVPKDHQLMYEGMINTISSLNNKKFEQKFLDYSEQFKNAKLDPKKIASFAPGIYYYNQKRVEEAKNEYLDEGKITSKLNINQNYKDDKNAENLNQQFTNNYNKYLEIEEFKDLK